jgi:competence protein ComEA
VLLAVLALRPLLRPPPIGPIGPVATAQGCVLAEAGSGAACACSELPPALRRLYDLPLPLNRANAAALERVPGIGTVRAQAIAAERERGGPFRTLKELTRVHGIGRITAARLAPYFFVGEADPAC